MVATLCLFTCVVATAQPADRNEWLLAPRLGKGQELVYRGITTEEASRSGVQFSRGYRLETRVFVLDTPARGADVAVFTVLIPSGTRSEQATAGSVRLELARIDLQGRVVADPGVSLAVPLDGPPTLECGAFLETPQNRIAPNKAWEVKEAGRPAQTWKVVGTEAVNGSSCVKLVGAQQSDDWDHPRADRTAWRRKDTVWVAPNLGVAYRVDRVIERREPARTEPTHKLLTSYELATSLQYPGQLFEDRRREIRQALTLIESAVPLLPNPGKYGPQIEALLVRVGYHLDNQPPTPYREAVLHVKRRLEAAKRGEPLPTLPAEEVAPVAQVIGLGKPAPDFVVPDFTSRESARLRRWLGRPILLVFYHPASQTASDVLRFAKSIHEAYQSIGVTVIGMAVSDDGDKVRKQRTDLRLTFPVLSGSGLRLSYDVEATPKLVVIDSAGVVRGAYTGWGRETAAEVTEELKRWLEPTAKK